MFLKWKILKYTISNLNFLCFFLFNANRYAIIYEKGYQETDKAIVTTTTKVKGTTFVDFGKFNSSLFNGVQIYDPEDYVIPPQVICLHHVRKKKHSTHIQRLCLNLKQKFFHIGLNLKQKFFHIGFKQFWYD